MPAPNEMTVDQYFAQYYPTRQYLSDKAEANPEAREQDEVVLQSPDGKFHRLKVANNGTVSTEDVE